MHGCWTEDLVGTNVLDLFHPEDPAGATAGYVLNVRDVTERRALEADIVHHAHHDALTGVANRRAVTARLEAALARFGRSA